MSDFENTFIKWLEQNLKEEIPNQVKAFSFNLNESAFEEGYKFGVELIGAERFDEIDEDWACDEIWEPAQRQIFIPVSYSGENWEECLKNMRSLLLKVIDSNKPFIKKLKLKEGIGIGFVDGDLDIIWQKRH